METVAKIADTTFPETVDVDGIPYQVTRKLNSSRGNVLRGIHPGTKEPVVLHLVNDTRDLDVLNPAIAVRNRLNGALTRDIMPEFLCGERKPGEWWATNFLPGESLWQKNARRTALRTVDPAQRVRETVAEAIALLTIMETYWTPHGLLHRDVKPDNLVIKPDGNMGVIDWEMASTLMLEAEMRRAMATPEEKTPPKKRNGEGTILFLAPEIISEQIWSGACDDFAVGVTALSGLGLTESIFPGKNQILIDKHTGVYRDRLTESMQRFRINALEQEPWFRAMAQKRKEKRPPWDEALWGKPKNSRKG